jgi:TRAP-type mannitol/chloroaromatic compound transport system permease small subunit
MKLYWAFVFLFFCFWIILSHLNPEPSWWSVFTSNRSTDTPLMEEISIIKVTFFGLIVAGLHYILKKFKFRWIRDKGDGFE